MEDDNMAMTIRYRPVPILNVVAETPAPDHGDTTDKPRPMPKAIRTTVSAQETTAPAATAGHETPAIEGSPVSIPGWITTTSKSVMAFSPCRIAAKSCCDAVLIGREPFSSRAGTICFYCAWTVGWTLTSLQTDSA